MDYLGLIGQTASMNNEGVLTVGDNLQAPTSGTFEGEYLQHDAV